MWASEHRWRGSVRMGMGWGSFVGRAGDNASHAHHAIQLVLAGHGQHVELKGRRAMECCGMAIGADVAHRLRPSTHDVTLVYLEPHSRSGRALLGWIDGPSRVLSDEQVARVGEVLAADDPRLDLQLVAALGIAGGSARDSNDALIESIIERLPEFLSERISVATWIRDTGLSDSRFRRRFRDHAGMPLLPFLRWRRMLTAMSRILSGQTLTDAAIAAGFADVAHFNRTFRRHFGITPSTLLRLS